MTVNIQLDTKVFEPQRSQNLKKTKSRKIRIKVNTKQKLNFKFWLCLYTKKPNPLETLRTVIFRSQKRFPQTQISKATGSFVQI